MLTRLIHAVVVLGTMFIAMYPARAQPRPQPRGIDVNFSVAPTVNWLKDVQINLGDLQASSGGQPSQDLQERADSLLLLFNEGEFPAQIGFEAGLSMTASRGWIGLRAGLHLLNTGGVFNGAEYFDEDRLRENFVTLLVGLQLQKVAGPALFYVFGGPEFRYHLDLMDESAVSAEVVRDNLEPLSTAATAGVGVEVQMMGLTITPEVRYAFGLSGVSDRTFEADGIPFRLGEGHRLDNLIVGLVFGL